MRKICLSSKLSWTIRSNAEDLSLLEAVVNNPVQLGGRLTVAAVWLFHHEACPAVAVLVLSGQAAFTQESGRVSVQEHGQGQVEDPVPTRVA
jgi:hypothetical protein